MKIRAQAIKLSVFVTVGLLVGALLYVTLGQTTIGSSTTFSARMNDVSGLKPGDIVRVAGVRVGQVDDFEVEDGNIVLVTFHVDSQVSLTESTHAVVRYQNLLGDRYLELTQDGQPGDELAAGSTIPLERTAPALDLDVLLNGFKPLFQGLQPNEINELASNLIATLQGQGGTLQTLLSRTSSLTNGLADRDETIGSLVSNLGVVLAGLDERDVQLRTSLGQLQKLVSGLAEDRSPIVSAVDSINVMAASLTRLLVAVRPDLAGSIAELGGVAKVLQRNSAALEKLLVDVPRTQRQATNAGSHGAFFNYFLCSVQIVITGPDGKPLHSPTINSNNSTKRCQ